MRMATLTTLALHHLQSIHRAVPTASGRIRRSQPHGQEPLQLVFSQVALPFPRPELNLVQLPQRVGIHKPPLSRQTGIIHPHILNQCHSLCLQRHSQRRRCNLRERERCRPVLRLEKSVRYRMCAISPMVLYLRILRYCGIARQYRRSQHQILSSETQMDSCGTLYSDIRILLRKKLALWTKLKR